MTPYTIGRRGLAALLLLAVLAGAGADAPAASAQTFPGLRLRGLLSDLQGIPREGLTTVTARVYATPSGGTALYTEVFSALVSAGSIDLVLGIGTGTPSGDLTAALLPDGSGNVERYLALQIEPDETEMTPRRRITAGPFAAVAMRAVNANQLGGVMELDLFAGQHTFDGLCFLARQTRFNLRFIAGTSGALD